MKENNKSPKFDEVGNVILTRKVETPKAEVKRKVGRPKKAETPKAEVKIEDQAFRTKNPKKKEGRHTKTPKTPKIDIIKELKEFDKTFGITDEQIVKYIRGKMK